jgi:SAM-dependent methyltransferase
MDTGTFAVEAVVEETHWWFTGRRRLFAREIARLRLPADAPVIDIGTGTGSNLRMLRDIGFTNVRGVDSSDDAIRYCTTKGLGPVERGSILSVPVADASQSLVLATDVIEHVEDDARALREVTRVLAPSGFAIITVPTFPSLWGLQDKRAQHKRRYRLGPLLHLLRSAGLTPIRRYYFNYLLFVPIWLARQIISLLRVELESENEVNTPAINRLLTGIFRFDCATAPVIHPPFGVSALVVAKRKQPAR